MGQRGSKWLNESQTRVCQLTDDRISAAESVRVTSVAWKADTLGAVGPCAALCSGSTRIGQIAGVLALPVITNHVVWAH